jgi:hypothetical protein
MKARSDGPGWQAMISWLLAFVLLFVGLMVGEPRGSGIIDPELVAFVIFLIVCVPIFCLGVVFGIVAIVQGQPWGYASGLLNLIVMAALLFFRLHPSTPATPAEQVKIMQERERSTREAKIRRDNGDISLSEDSLIFKIVTAPWWRMGCACVVGTAAVLWAGRRLREQFAVAQSRIEPGAPVLEAHCPKCKGDVTKILKAGGSICPACHTQFIFTRGTSTVSGSFASVLGELLFEGSKFQRVGALLCLSILVILGLVWCGLMLLGQWIASKNVIGLMLFVGLLLAVMLAKHSRDQT